MKKLYVISIILVICIVNIQCSSQRTKKIPERKFSISDLKSSTDIFNYRICGHGQIIDFRILPDSTKLVYVTNIIKEEPFTHEEEIKQSKGKLKLRYYVEKLKLNPYEKNVAFKLLEKHNIYETFSKDSLKNLKTTDPENWFIIEKKSNGDYYKLEYDDPENSKESQVQKFTIFYSELENRLRLKDKFMDFDFRFRGCFSVFCEKGKFVKIITY